jgi:CrcB protein
MSYLIVGLAGMLGSAARYSLSKLIGKYNNRAYPWATFLINITGAFLLGVVSAFNFNNTAYILAVEGFLGAFTTFSAFMYDGACLIRNNKYLSSVTYIGATIILGVVGFSLGYVWFLG